MTTKNFTKLIESHQGLIFTVCFQLVQNYHEAQNLTQETFLSAFNHIDTVSEENLKGWLARIATNKSKDFLKSAYNKKVALSEDLSELDVLKTELTPERIYINRESQSRITKEILNLKEPYHSISVMFFLEEKSIEEIASATGRPKKTVQTQLSRSRIILKNLLKEDGL